MENSTTGYADRESSVEDPLPLSLSLSLFHLFLITVLPAGIMRGLTCCQMSGKTGHKGESKREKESERERETEYRKQQMLSSPMNTLEEPAVR